MPYCTNCGSEVTGKMLFCHECGNKLITPQAGFENNKSHDYAPEAETNEQEDIPSRGIKKSRLYKQWVKYAGLPVEKILSMRSPRDMPVRGESNVQHLRLTYILLGVGILVCIGLAILLVKIW